jgi:ferredoxin
MRLPAHGHHDHPFCLLSQLESEYAMLQFNDERIEAKHEETLLQAARRHGSLVGFLCDGRGICQTCLCYVFVGAENLSEPSGLERAALEEKCWGTGYRLGCQARLMGSGPVSVVSRAEELRRRARDVLSGSREESLVGRLEAFSVESLSAATDLFRGLTSVLPHAIPQLLKYPPTPARLLAYARDTMRLAIRMSGHNPTVLRATRRTNDN